MSQRRCRIAGPSGEICAGSGQPLLVIAGPCVLEGPDLAVRVAETLGRACEDLGLPYVFKASFDKANRTSVDSPRGPGLEDGLAQLAEIRSRFGVPVTTDVHTPEQAPAVAEVVDLLQIPAFLCRQTDLLVAVGEAAAARGRTVNVKKGQFLSPEEMRGPVDKVAATGCPELMLTERGTFFGYHRLVNDFVGLGDLLEGAFLAQDPRPAVCFDATHSVQLPGAGKASGGRRERIPTLAAAAVAAGVDALFLECHPDPERAPSDGSNMLPLDRAPDLLARLARIRGAAVG
jgi:2-dehydro-3-deoxyphosphooctonate aldolase (KDO 8-P synthase)